MLAVEHTVLRCPVASCEVDSDRKGLANRAKLRFPEENRDLLTPAVAPCDYWLGVVVESHRRNLSCSIDLWKWRIGDLNP